MHGERGFSLVELMMVVAITGILAAIAIPAYLGYMDGAKTNAAIDNFDTLVRLVKFEASKRNIPGQDGPADILVLADFQGRTSPMDQAVPALAQGSAPAGDGQVVIDVIDFRGASSAAGTTVTIRADVTNDGVARADRTCSVRLE